MHAATLGILGANATTSADFNLLAHIAMGLALLFGMLLARLKRFRAHMFCQASVLLLNLPLVALIMFPSFAGQVGPEIPGKLSDSYYWVATVHTVIGTAAQLLGLWIILVAATRIVPRRLRFTRYKLWMRTELGLWWLVLAVGIGVYLVWYRPVTTNVHAGKQGAGGYTVIVKNFAFSPHSVTVPVGTTVTWANTQGVHTVTADNQSFGSKSVSAGHRFTFTFTHPGVYRYYCRFHGAVGGVGMAGTITVKARK